MTNSFRPRSIRPGLALLSAAACLTGLQSGCRSDPYEGVARHLDAARPGALFSAAVAVEADELVFLAGKVAPLPGQPFEAEVGAVIDAITEELARLDLTLNDLIQTNVYLTEAAQYDAMNSVYSRMIPKPYPARTTVIVAGLPGGARLEIQAVAAVPDGIDD